MQVTPTSITDEREVDRAQWLHNLVMQSQLLANLNLSEAGGQY